MIQTHYSTMAEQLERISDPRQRRGQRHEWQYLLLVIASALMAGQRTGRAMAKWAQEHQAELLGCLQPHRQHIPSAATLYRALEKVPIAELESEMSGCTTQIDEADAAAGRIQTKQGELLLDD